jgi:hypothetical protein
MLYSSANFWHSSRLKERYNDLILTYLEISNTSIMIYIGLRAECKNKLGLNHGKYLQGSFGFPIYQIKAKKCLDHVCVMLLCYSFDISVI